MFNISIFYLLDSWRVGLFQYLTLDGDIELKHRSGTSYLKRFNRIAGGF